LLNKSPESREIPAPKWCKIISGFFVDNLVYLFLKNNKLKQKKESPEKKYQSGANILAVFF